MTLNCLKLLGINTKDQSSIRCFVGASFLFFGMGGVLIWGQVSIYIFSFYRQDNENLSIGTTQLILNIAILPITIGMVFSLNLAEKIGFENLIKICGFMYPFGIFCSAFSENFYLFSIFYVALTCTSFSLSCVPIITCLYSHFPKDSGKVSGLLFFFNGMSSLFYSLCALKLINPNNVQADIEYSEGGQSIYLFNKAISDNLPRCLLILSLIYAAFCISGSLFVTKKAN